VRYCRVVCCTVNYFVLHTCTEKLVNITVYDLAVFRLSLFTQEFYKKIIDISEYHPSNLFVSGDSSIFYTKKKAI
jgi:hypothetical protein